MTRVPACSLTCLKLATEGSPAASCQAASTERALNHVLPLKPKVECPSVTLRCPWSRQRSSQAMVEELVEAMMFPCTMPLSELADYVEYSTLPAALRPTVETHLRECPACYRRVAAAPLEHWVTWYDDVAHDDPAAWQAEMAEGAVRTVAMLDRKKWLTRCRRLRTRIAPWTTGRPDPVRDKAAFYAALDREERARLTMSADDLCRLLRWHQANLARALPAPERHTTEEWQRLRAAIELLGQVRAVIIAHYALPADAGADPYLGWHFGAAPRLEQEPPPWTPWPGRAPEEEDASSG